MKKQTIAITTIIGSIIGAGILGIPYVVMKSGFGIGLIHLILIALIVTITYLYLGETILRTKKPHQLTGYAEIYLGEKGKKIMFLALAFGIYSALIAYLIGEGESLSQIFFSSSQYSLHLGIIFWIFLSAIAFFGIQALKKCEPLGVAMIIILILAIGIIFWNKIEITNLTYNNLEFFFAPFGVILFAFLGFTIIPEAGIILKSKKDKHKIKKTIIFANLICFLIYLAFTIIVLGALGKNTPEISTIALGKTFIILGMITMFTSYLALTIAFIDTLRLDYKKSKNKAWLYTIIPPLIIFILLNIFEKAGFTKVLGIGGVISGGLTAILVLAIAKKAKQQGQRKPEYEIKFSKILATVITIIFIIGAGLEIYNVLV